MSLLDDYSQNMSDEDSQAANLADVRRKRAEIERNIVISESDLKKLLREKQNLEVEQRKLKKEEERIRIDRDALNRKLRKLEDDQRLLEEEIHRLRKKLKTLPT